jgi:hypothetical protein
MAMVMRASAEEARAEALARVRITLNMLLVFINIFRLMPLLLLETVVIRQWM